MGDVLHGMNPSNGIGAPKVEGPKIDGLVGFVVLAMKSDPHEALLQYIFPANIDLKNAIGQLNAGYPDEAFVGSFVDTDTPMPLLPQRARRSIDGGFRVASQL